MNISITGASGFIGGRLTKILSEKNHNINCLVRTSSNTKELTKLNVNLIEGDLGDSASFQKLLKGTDTVYHLAAFVSDWGKKEDFIKYNYKATEDLLNESINNGVKKFVYLSTSSVLWRSDFWDVHKLVDIDESYPYPDSYNDFYNESKSQAEKLVLSYNGKSGLQTTVIRPSGVWGAGDTVILPRIIRAAEKRFLIPTGDGSGLVSPCHIDNLVDGIMLSGDSQKSAGSVYFINDGQRTNHIEFIKKLLDACGISWSPGILIPYKVGYTIAASIELVHKLLGLKKPPVISRFAVAAIAGSRTYSIEKAKRELNFVPKVTFADGMQELKDWIVEIGGYSKLL